MKCPKCETLLSCPCKACEAGRDAHNVKATKWLEARDGIIGCPNCGFEAHEDYWTDLELKQFEDMEEAMNHWYDDKRREEE